MWLPLRDLSGPAALEAQGASMSGWLPGSASASQGPGPGDHDTRPCGRLAGGPQGYASCVLPGDMVERTAPGVLWWFMVIKWVAVDNESFRNSAGNKIQLYGLLVTRKVKAKRHHLQRVVSVSIAHKEPEDLRKCDKLRRTAAPVWCSDQVCTAWTQSQGSRWAHNEDRFLF